MITDEHRHPAQHLTDDENSLHDASCVRLIEEHEAELRALRAEREMFVRTLKHDLSGPLMGIGGFADLLLDQAGAQLDEKSRQYLCAIITSADQLAHVLNKAVALSRERETGWDDASGFSPAVSANGAGEAAASRQFANALD